MERRFDDEEVSLILRRALEADAGRPETPGLTLAQLKEIASEVGIDPARVESAALTVQAEGATPRSSGARVTARYDLRVDGKMAPDRQADLLSLIRAAMGRQGVVTTEPGGFAWKARDAFGGRYVTVRSERGRTRVEALGNFRDGAAVTAGAGGTAGLMVTAVALKAVGGVAALGIAGPLALVAGAAVPAWALYRRWFAREDAALRKVVLDIAARIGAEANPAAPDPARALPREGSSPGDGPPPRP